MAELLQHLLTVGQVRGHELGSVHFAPLSDLPDRDARLKQDRGEIVKKKFLTKSKTFSHNTTAHHRHIVKV